jgi:O-antigen/teichoic acid export membrane protein
VAHARQHLRGASALAVSQAGTRLLSFLVLIVVQKNVTVAENGLFQLALRLAFLMALFTEFGIRGYLLREVARRRENQAAAQAIFGNVLNVRLALVAPVWAVGTLILWAANYPRTTLAAVAIFYVFTVLDSFAMLFKYLFRAYDRMEFDAIFSLLGRGLLLLGLLALWRWHTLTIPAIGTVHVAAAAAETLLLAVCITKVLGLRLVQPWDRAGVGMALRRSIPFAVINIIGTLYMSTGTLALSKMMGEEAVGYYNAASRLPEALQFLPTAVVNALIPFLSRHHRDRELVARYYGLLVRYMGYAAVILSAVLVFAPEWVIRVIARKEYTTALAVFRYYGVWLILIYYQIIGANLLICLDAEKIVMVRAVVALALNVVLNIVGIRLWGLNGAAAALVATEAFSAVLYLLALAHRGVPTPWSAIARIAVVGAVSVALLTGLNARMPDTLRVAVAVAGGSLAACVFLWHDDRSLVRRILRG